MSANAVKTSPSKQNKALLPKLPAGLNPALVKQLQGYVEQLTVELTEQVTKQVTRQITKQVTQQVTAEVTSAVSARLESQYDARLAQGIADGVAQKVLQIIEQNRLARYRQFGPSSEANQLSLFNEAEKINEESPDNNDEAAQNTTKQAGAKRHKARGYRRPLPPELPRVDVVIDIDESKALQPMANLMRDTLLDGSVMHIDETTVQVLKEPGKKATNKSYMWVQYGGPPDKPVVLFDYERTRSSAVPLRLLEGWSGHL